MIVDGHEDLALNALFYGRNYLESARSIRAREADSEVETIAGRCMLGLDEWLGARVGLILATVAAIPRAFAVAGDTSYVTPQEAHDQALAQLDVYRRWTELSERIVLVCGRRELDDVVASWEEGSKGTVGLVLLMENADPIRTPDEVGFWAELGVRAVGPAWHANRYAGDTRAGGPLTPAGRDLLAELGRAGLILDLTHMSEQACLDALDLYPGSVVATHAHSRRTVPIDRLLSDRVIEGIRSRNGIVGVLPLNWALAENWRRGDGKTVSLDAVAAAIETVCEVAGDVDHVGLGTDFDGGQGAEAAPSGIETIGDLPKLATVLGDRGWAKADVEAVMGGNWVRVLREQLL